MHSILRGIMGSEKTSASAPEGKALASNELERQLALVSLGMAGMRMMMFTDGWYPNALLGRDGWRGTVTSSKITRRSHEIVN